MQQQNQTSEKKDLQVSVISSCAATSCRHNEAHQCTAGTITIAMVNNAPACGTYEASSK
jgi:hypothetical protein